MRAVLLIGLGSFIGGISRYLLSIVLQNKILSTFPYGTLTVNIIGCFLIGLAFGFHERIGLTIEWRLFIVTGMLGGFTTFSAFSFESIDLFRNGQPGLATLYIAGSILFGLLATLAGIRIAH